MLSGTRVPIAFTRHCLKDMAKPHRHGAIVLFLSPLALCFLDPLR